MKRPFTVAIVAWLLITAGVFGFAVHLKGLGSPRLSHSEDLLLLVVPLLAVASGAFILLRHNWARWLALAWIAFHVAISFDSLQKLAVHVLLLVLITYSLFRADARAYFQAPKKVDT